MSGVARWRKLGDPVELAGGYGKRLIRQPYFNPKTSEPESYVLYGQPDWSVVLPVTSDGSVVVVEQYKQGCDQVTIELPAGTADATGEDSRAVATRELLEETGYSPGDVTALGPALFMSTRNSWTRFHPFLATNCRRVGEPKPDASEVIAVRCLPLEEWLAFALAECVEPSAVVATVRAIPHLVRQKLLRADSLVPGR